jgi:Leucine-rich repeat (LRR) protein
MTAAEEPSMKKLKMTSELEMNNSNFEDLPNEIFSNILDYMSIRDLIRCGQTFRRLRFVVHDELLWKKVNLSNQTLVSAGLFKLILERGCEHLNVSDQIDGNLYINQFTKLKCLNVAWKYAINDHAKFLRNAEVLVKLLCNSNLLEKLELFYVNLDCLSLTSCTWNFKNLKVLRLSYCNRGYEKIQPLKLNFIQPIVDHCSELVELSFYKTCIEEDAIDYLVKNITPKLSKLSLDATVCFDKYIQVLVTRCTNLTELSLSGSRFTNDSVNYIIENLHSTLEKLCLIGTSIQITKLFQLKAMKKLNVLDLFSYLVKVKTKELECFRNSHIQLYYAQSNFAKPNLNSDNLSAFRSYK